MDKIEISSVSEALSVGGAVALQGMCIVFSVLILLMIVLFLMRVVFYKDPSKQKQVQQAAEAPAEAIDTEIDTDDDELIAVLTAEVAASLNTSTYHLKIKSYRRVGNKAPAWNKAGLNETVSASFSSDIFWCRLS